MYSPPCEQLSRRILDLASKTMKEETGIINLYKPSSRTSASSFNESEVLTCMSLSPSFSFEPVLKLTFSQFLRDVNSFCDLRSRKLGQRGGILARLGAVPVKFLFPLQGPSDSSKSTCCCSLDDPNGFSWLDQLEDRPIFPYLDPFVRKPDEKEREFSIASCFAPSSQDDARLRFVRVSRILLPPL